MTDWYIAVYKFMFQVHTLYRKKLMEKFDILFHSPDGLLIRQGSPVTSNQDVEFSVSNFWELYKCTACVLPRRRYQLFFSTGYKSPK